MYKKQNEKNHENLYVIKKIIDLGKQKFSDDVAWGNIPREREISLFKTFLRNLYFPPLNSKIPSRGTVYEFNNILQKRTLPNLLFPTYKFYFYNNYILIVSPFKQSTNCHWV